MRNLCRRCRFYIEQPKSKKVGHTYRKGRMIGRIRLAMQEENMKGFELAAMLNVSPAHISQPLSFRRNTSIATIFKLEDALNISLIKTEP